MVRDPCRAGVVCGLIGAAILALAAPTLADDAADRAAIRALVERLFAGYGRKDAPAVLACYAADCPEREQRRREIAAATSLPGRLRFSEIAYSDWRRPDGKSTELVLEFREEYADPRTGRSAVIAHSWLVRVVREAGAWRFWSHDTTQRALIAPFLAGDAATRAKIVREHPDFAEAGLLQWLFGACKTQAEQGSFREAHRSVDLAFEVARALKDELQITACHSGRGLVLACEGRNDEAIAEYRSAIAPARAEEKNLIAAMLMVDLGKVYHDAGRYRQARSTFEECLALERKMDPLFARLLTRKTLNGLGSSETFCGDLVPARRHLDECLAECRQLGDANEEIAARINLANVDQGEGKPKEALAGLDRALEMCRRAGNRLVEITVLNNRGKICVDIGRHADALRANESSLEIARSLKNRRMEAINLLNLGNAYRLAGRSDVARERFERALAIAREQQNYGFAATVLNDLGVLYRTTGELKKARDAYRESLAYIAKSGDGRGQLSIRLNLANQRIDDGDPRQALADIEEGVALSQRLGDRRAETNFLLNRGVVQAGFRDYAAAQASLSQSLAMAEALDDPDGMMRCHYGMGILQKKQGRWPQAADAFRRAIGYVEQIRVGTEEPLLQASFFAGHNDLYLELCRALLEIPGRDAEALAAAELARARSLVELIQSAKADVFRDVPPADRLAEQRLRQEIVRLSLAVRRDLDEGTTPSRADDDRSRLARARSEYESFRRRLFLAHPELRMQRGQFEPASLDAVSRLLESPRRCLLAYLVGPTETILFVVRGAPADRPGARATVQTHRIAVSAKDLQQRVDEMRAQCQRPIAGLVFETDDLYRWLLAPADAVLAECDHAIIVPDGVLARLPFQALRDPDGRTVMERFALSYAPSVTALVKMVELGRKRSGGASPPVLVAVGRPRFGSDLPDLPATEKEVARIAELFPDRSHVFVGPRASKGRILAALPEARYVHFATHGILNDSAPLYSAVALTPDGAADDGYLTARELMDVDLKSELTVLSACQTALGENVRGEGLLGLTWALFVAGTPTSVVTQWSVADESTGRLMADFYQALNAPRPAGGRLSKVETLRQAQLRMMGDRRTRPPYYWAPFVLVGDWH